MRYQTEIHVAADRYVCLQLPDYVPEGRAIVTVTVEVDGAGAASRGDVAEDDRHDIEWSDEFDDEATGRG